MLNETDKTGKQEISGVSNDEWSQYVYTVMDPYCRSSIIYFQTNLLCSRFWRMLQKRKLAVVTVHLIVILLVTFMCMMIAIQLVTWEIFSPNHKSRAFKWKMP